MVIGRLIGARAQEGEGQAVLTPELGAAGLVIMAGHRDGVSTEVERQEATSALMKLLHLPGPKAASLRAEAERFEEDGDAFAEAASAMPPDEKEQLVTCLWTLMGPVPEARPPLLDSVGRAFGLTEERLAALRPR